MADIYYFQGENILAEYQGVLHEVAAREDVPLLLFQEEIDANPNRLLFYEFIHLSSLGYRLIAERLLEWFESHATMVLSPPCFAREDSA